MNLYCVPKNEEEFDELYDFYCEIKCGGFHSCDYGDVFNFFTDGEGSCKIIYYTKYKQVCKDFYEELDNNNANSNTDFNISPPRLVRIEDFIKLSKIAIIKQKLAK